MRYVLLGHSGLRVSELGLGTMTFGHARHGADRAESTRIYEAFREAGGNLIDTADGYADGVSEALLGELIASERERIVLMTKFGMGTRTNDPNAATGSRKAMADALEGSLRRLRSDYVDVYWVHVWDPYTPLEELMRGLDDLVRGGKVRYLGISNAPAWVVARANTMAQLRGWTPFVALQIPYSLMQRTVERELVPMARALGLAITAWGALGAGILTGKYNEDPQASGRARGSNRLDQRSLRIAAAIGELAHELERPPSQVALAWLRQRSVTTIPLLGARTLAQLEQNMGCLSLRLEREQLRRLDEVSEIELGFPAHFLERQRRIDAGELDPTQ